MALVRLAIAAAAFPPHTQRNKTPANTKKNDVNRSTGNLRSDALAEILASFFCCRVCVVCFGTLWSCEQDFYR